MSDPLTLLCALLPEGVRAGGGRIADLHGPLMPGEAAAVSTARPARRAEFTAGRCAARQLLGEVALPRCPTGLPLWPAGVTGSISHAGGWALAVASRAVRAVGLDLEMLGADLPLSEIATAAELAALGGSDPVLLFSAKEAAYKAQFPLSGRMLGFHDLQVTLAPGGFTARFAVPAAPFARGDVISGRQMVADNMVVSLAVIAA